MKPLVWFLLLALGFTLRGEPPRSKAASVPVLIVGQRTFLDAAVSKLDAFTARITHSTGAATVPAWEMSAAQQKSFGFDPAATAAERARREVAIRAAQAEADDRERLAIERQQASEDARRTLQAITAEKKLQSDQTALVARHPQSAPARPALRAGSLLGMNEDQVRAKYGEPVKQPAPSADEPAEKLLTFEKAEIYIVAHFWHGRIAKVTYVHKGNFDRLFVQAEVQAILAFHGEGWIFEGTTPNLQNWRNGDSTLAAGNRTDGGVLIVGTAEYFREAKRLAAAALEALR